MLPLILDRPIIWRPPHSPIPTPRRRLKKKGHGADSSCRLNLSVDKGENKNSQRIGWHTFFFCCWWWWFEKEGGGDEEVNIIGFCLVGPNPIQFTRRLLNLQFSNGITLASDEIIFGFSPNWAHYLIPPSSHPSIRPSIRPLSLREELDGKYFACYISPIYFQGMQ